MAEAEVCFPLEHAPQGLLSFLLCSYCLVTSPGAVHAELIPSPPPGAECSKSTPLMGPYLPLGVQRTPLPFQASSDFVLILLPQGRQLVPSLEEHPHFPSKKGVALSIEPPCSSLQGNVPAHGARMGSNPGSLFLFFFFLFTCTWIIAGIRKGKTLLGFTDGSKQAVS